MPLRPKLPIADANGKLPEARAKAAARDSYLAGGGGYTGGDGSSRGSNGVKASGLPRGYKRTRGGQIVHKGKVVHTDIGKVGARFTEGKLAGKTYDQANQDFEAKWEKAPAQVKEKYANRAATDLAPSEAERWEKERAGDKPKNKLPVAGSKSTSESPVEGDYMANRGDAAARAREFHQQANTSKKDDPDTSGRPQLNLDPSMKGANDEVWSKPGVKPEGATDQGDVWVTKNGGVVPKDSRDPNTYSRDPKTGLVTGTQMAWDKSPDFTSKAKELENPSSGIKSIGDGSSAENGWTPQLPVATNPPSSTAAAPVANSNAVSAKPALPTSSERRTGPGGKYSAADREAAEKQAEARTKAESKTPAVPTTADIRRKSLENFWGGVSNMVTPVYEGIRDFSLSPNVRKEVAAKHAEANTARANEQKQRAASLDADIEAADRNRIGLPVAPTTATAVATKPPIAAPATPPGQKFESVGESTTGVPPLLQRPAEAAPKQPAAAGPRINPQTGLPFGFRPGDAVAPEHQRKADESVARQKAAPALAPVAKLPLMPRGPASQPTRTDSALDNPNSAFSNAAYARTAAAQQKGYNDEAIRNGTASEATRATNPDLVNKIKADTAAMSGLRLKPDRPSLPISSRVVSTRPATTADRKRLPVAR